MRRWLAVLCLATCAAATAPEPQGFWQGPTDAPTPATISGGSVIHTDALIGLLRQHPLVLVDVSSAPRRPPELRPGVLWLPLTHRDIPHSIWIPGAGLGTVPLEIDAQYRSRLAALTGHDFGATIVVYCHERCWLSWNAAKRAIGYGYRHVAWYPDGVEGWTRAGQPTAAAQPVG
jgi:PQQ-dependent catabolism-associated CXXCW motif protein